MLPYIGYSGPYRRIWTAACMLPHILLLFSPPLVLFIHFIILTRHTRHVSFAVMYELSSGSDDEAKQAP